MVLEQSAKSLRLGMLVAALFVLPAALARWRLSAALERHESGRLTAAVA